MRPQPLSGGFTLIEMLVSMAVLALILAIAVPGMAGFVRTSKVRSAQSELIGSLMLARSEAVKRGVPAGVAATAPVTGNPFGPGWTVWVDSNGNGAVDTGEEIVRRYPDVSAGIVLTSNANAITFAPTGFLANTALVNLKVCGQGSTGNGYAVAVQPAGFVDLGEQAACP